MQKILLSYFTLSVQRKEETVKLQYSKARKGNLNMYATARDPHFEMHSSASCPKMHINKIVNPLNPNLPISNIQEWQAASQSDSHSDSLLFSFSWEIGESMRGISFKQNSSASFFQTRSSQMTNCGNAVHKNANICKISLGFTGLMYISIGLFNVFHSLCLCPLIGRQRKKAGSSNPSIKVWQTVKG